LFVVEDEHERFLLHQKYYQSENCSTVKSVGDGHRVDKRVGQFELPNGVKLLMRRSVATMPVKPKVSCYTGLR